MLRSEAIDFLQNTLNIDEVNTKLKFSKQELLREVCRKISQIIPYQNLSLLAMEPSDYHLPSNDDIRAAYFSKIGGICYSGANFTQQLFNALGYVAFLIGCDVSFSTANGKPFTHAACIVKDCLSSNERFFFDFTSGYPSFEAVPLHSLPQIYHHAFLEYKFERLKNGNVVRMHKVRPSSSLDGKLPLEKEWQTFYEFEEIPRDKDFMTQYQTPIYTDPSYGNWFLKALKIVLYPENEALTLNDYVLKTWKKGSKVVTIHLKDENELKEAIKQYFPTLANINVHKAVLNWNENKLKI